MSHGFFHNDRIKAIASEIAEIAGYLWQRGWAERNAGNISINITGLLPVTSFIFDDSPSIPFPEGFPHLSKNIFLLTATGTRMRDLSKAPEQGLCFIRITGNGNAYQLAETHPRAQRSQSLAPTSELPTHLAIQEMLKKSRPEQKVLIHAHIPEFIALTQISQFKTTEALNRLLSGMHPEIRMFVPKGIGVVAQSPSGSELLAKETVKQLEHHDVVVWEKHGLLAVGETISEAFDTMDLVTQAAKIFFLCKNAGYTPEGI
jgi:rhamnulose-1-phosphate aldolase